MGGIKAAPCVPHDNGYIVSYLYIKDAVPAQGRGCAHASAVGTL